MHTPSIRHTPRKSRFRFRWRGLRLKIIAWSFVPTAIILFAVALVTFYAYQRVTEDLAMERDRELTRLSAGQLATELARYTDVLAATARLAAISPDDLSFQRASPGLSIRRDALRRSRSRLGVFDAGVIAQGFDGTVVGTEPERSEIQGLNWSNRSYFQQMLQSPRPLFSDIVTDGARGAEVIVVAVPITGEDGEFQGVVAGMLRLRGAPVAALGKSIQLRSGGEGSTYLVDDHGRAIYHSDLDRIGDDFSAQEVVQWVGSGESGAVRTRDFAGREIVAGFAPVPGTRWGLITQERWAALIAPVQGYQQSLLLLLGLGLLLPALVVMIGIGRITRPIEELIVGAREVAAGNFGRSIRAATGDEIEELAEQFSRMSVQLQESYSELERRVESRTRELATLNAIAAVVSRSLDLHEILHDSLEETLAVMGMEIGGAYRLVEESPALILMAHRGISADLAEAVGRLPLRVAQTRRPDGMEQPVVMRVGDLPAGEIKDLLLRDGFRQLVAVPLVAKGRIVGAIILAHRSPRALATEELSLLAAIGQQVGMAVENARLYEKAEESAAAAERNRLARDLHDAVSQTLFSASLIAEVLPRLWQRHPEEGRRRLEELRSLTRGALAEMRTLVLELRPSALTEAALSDLLRQLTEAIAGRARLPITLHVDGQGSLPPDVQIALYRIAQEALNNVAKHSGASQVEIRLRHASAEPDSYEEGAGVELRVIDNGRGFDPGDVSGDHLGLGIMRERAQAIGATLTVESQPGDGTRITVRWSPS